MSANPPSPKGSAAEQIINGTHPVIQDTKSQFQDFSHSAESNIDDSDQPKSRYHDYFSNLLTWEYPKLTGIVFLTTVTTIFAFRYLNMLRFIFKGAYWTFAIAAGLELAGKAVGAKGVVSSLRPRRYYTIPRESLETVFAELHELINFGMLEFQRVLYVESFPATLAAFLASFFGYFLIKYIPLWTLFLMSTVVAFTAPLVYLNNQDVIDNQITQISNLINAQIDAGKKVTERYAGDAAARARATASELTQKVQGYTHGSTHKAPETTRNDGASELKGTEFPTAPTNPLDSESHDPTNNDVEQHREVAAEPLLA